VRSPGPGGYVFLDAGIPRPGQPSRMDLLREEDGSLATEFLESLRAGTRFPAWTIDDLADIVPAIADRVGLIQSLRTSDQIVAAIFSLSSSTPYLFGDRREAFEADLRQLLHEANSSDLFSEHMQEIAAEIWRR
jgi:hypothetical protein